MANNLMSIYDANLDLAAVGGGFGIGPGGIGPGGIITEILAALPSAVAKPFQDYYRTKKQKELLELAIQVRRMERTKILETIQVLAKYEQLTPELAQMLMAAYNMPIY